MVWFVYERFISRFLVFLIQNFECKLFVCLNLVERFALKRFQSNEFDFVEFRRQKSTEFPFSVFFFHSFTKSKHFFINLSPFKSFPFTTSLHFTYKFHSNKTESSDFQLKFQILPTFFSFKIQSTVKTSTNSVE